MTKGAETVRRLPTKTDWNCTLRIVAFVASSWCLRRGATEAESCLECLRSVVLVKQFSLKFIKDRVDDNF